MLSEILPTSELSINLSQQSLVYKDKFPVKVSTQDLIKIVEKASTIPERLSAGFTLNESQVNEHLINSRLERWCQVVAKGNQQKFAKRFACDNLDIDTICQVLGSVQLAEAQALPAWVETLREAMQVAASIQEIPNNRDLEQRQYLDPEQPQPFEEVLLPFVDVARKKLIERTSPSCQLLSTAAHAQLERNLLEQLTGLCVFSLELEFSIFRSFNDSPLVRLIGQLQSSSSKQHFTEFVKGLLNDGLLSFFQEYSVLARLVTTATDFWIDAVGEFILQLASDWDKIQLTFHGDQELGQVVAVKTALSDPHNCGRSVIMVKFTSGLKLVYKPKDLGLEQAYFELLSWINQQGVFLPFKLLKVVNCSTHGWIEFVEALPCQDQQAVKQYYQRAGMLLCVVYSLRGTDCHCENLIACGEQPVLIDLETLLHHWIPAIKKDNAEAELLANECLQNSVAGTALLPGWQLAPYGQNQGPCLDLSGLGGVGEQEIPYRAMKWNHINTDSMVISHEQAKMLPKQNRPFGEGVDTSLQNHNEEIIEGFRQMYQFLMQRKEALLADNSPLAAFAHQKVRLVFRNTSVYFSILRKSLEPKFLRDGVDRSIELDILSRAFLSSEEKHPFWSLLVAEKQALEQLDIPYFAAYSNSNALIVNPNQTIEEFLNRPSYDDVISRLQQLTDADLAQQISIIRGSLYSCLTSEHLNSLPVENANLCLDTVASIEQAILVQQAIAIAQELQQQAIRGTDGSVIWIGMGYIPEVQRFQLQPLGHSLYDGVCGIALFLAGLATVTGSAEFGDLALASLQSLRQVLHNSDADSQQKLIEQMGIGGARGLASIVYAFVRVAEFLGEAELLQDAQQVVSLTQLDDTDVNQAPSIMNGTAATILSLLALHEAIKEPATLMQATAWGKHLVNTRIATDTGYKAWATSDGKVLTGFSHGAAGIAYALLQLYAATQDLAFLSAAEEAIVCEQSVFSLRRHCSDFRTATMDYSTLSSLTSWCHGVPGIALARLGSLAILDTTEIRQELEIALQITAQSGLQALDNLCCGNFSHIEALLVASEQLSRPEFLEIAQKQATWVMTRAEQVGSFQLLTNLPTEVYSPGFFQGTVGIGYGLLRLVYPDLLPSVLLWQ